jgi:dihydroorotase
VTLHHLIITLDDVAGGMLKPHLFCKPIAKRPEDRDRLLQAALEAHPKLSFGSDSAPHPTHKKECCGCAAGVFTAPMALACLADLFDQHDCLGNLQAFVSDRAHQIYGVEVPKKKVTLKRETFSVPEKYENVTPYLAGEDLAWRVTEIESSSP